jgi:hypothetical protein
MESDEGNNNSDNSSGEVSNSNAVQNKSVNISTNKTTKPIWHFQQFGSSPLEIFQFFQVVVY